MRTDHAFLSKFIRAKNYNTDAALISIEKYYTCIDKNLSYIKDVTPTQFTKAFESDAINCLRNRATCDGSAVAVFRVRNWKPKEVDIKGLQLAAVFLAEQYFMKPEFQVTGVCVIFDCDGLSFEHVRNLSVQELRRVIVTAQVNNLLPLLFNFSRT